MKFLLIVLFFLSTNNLFAQSAVFNKTVKIADLDTGILVQAYPEALLADEHGNAWLDPNYVVFTNKQNENLDLFIVRQKDGYSVQINYRLKKTKDSFYIPKVWKWQATNIPPNFIPVKYLKINKPSWLNY